MTATKRTNGRRVVSVWLPEFATDRIARRQTAANASGPMTAAATVMDIKGGHRLAAVNGRAAGAGLAPGLPLADARALEPQLSVFPADPENDTKALEKIAFWAGRYSPWTAVDRSAPDHTADGVPQTNHGLWLDISGCAHLFGGEEALITDLIRRLGRAGYRAQAGLADTPGTAWAAARFGTDGKTPFRIVPAGGGRDAIASLSVRALRLENTACRHLERLGLGRIGDLYPISRTALAQRAGLDPAIRLDQALGDRDEPISPLTPPPVLQVRLRFPDPIGLLDDIEAALGRLLPALCARLEHAGLGARRLDFTLYRIDGTTSQVTIGTGRPERDPVHLKRLFREKLDALDPGFGVETALLSARAADPFKPDQRQTAASGPGNHPSGKQQDELGRLIDRLANHLGPHAVTAIEPQESHLPERAQAHRPLVRGATPAAPETGHQDGFKQDGPTAPRPLYLLPMPEPVDALTPHPGSAPVAFQWRGRQRRILHAEGPERIAPEWWRGLISQGPGNEDRLEGPPETPAIPGDRDYYAVEDETGERFWLYRQNLETPVPGQAPKWFLHGLFP